MLDGVPHDVEPVFQVAGEEFQKARIFYAQDLQAVRPLAQEAQNHGKYEVDWWHVKKQILGGDDARLDRFASEFQFARVGIALTAGRWSSRHLRQRWSIPATPTST